MKLYTYLDNFKIHKLPTLVIGPDKHYKWLEICCYVEEIYGPSQYSSFSTLTEHGTSVKKL